MDDEKVKQMKIMEMKRQNMETRRQNVVIGCKHGDD